MEYSERLKKLPVQFFANLVEKVNKALAEGRDIINLGQGNPDQPTPSHIVKALQHAAEDPNMHKYSPFRGLQELRETLPTSTKPNMELKSILIERWPFFLVLKLVLSNCLSVC